MRNRSTASMHLWRWLGIIGIAVIFGGCAVSAGAATRRQARHAEAQTDAPLNSPALVQTEKSSPPTGEQNRVTVTGSKSDRSPVRAAAPPPWAGTMLSVMALLLSLITWVILQQRVTRLELSLRSLSRGLGKAAPGAGRTGGGGRAQISSATAPDPEPDPDPDLIWVRQFACDLDSGRYQRTDVPEPDLDRWLNVAARAEREGRDSEVSRAMADLMTLTRKTLGIDMVKPQLGASVQQPSIQVEPGGPLDGVVAEVVAVGLRTKDGVLRPARVTSRHRG